MNFSLPLWPIAHMFRWWYQLILVLLLWLVYLYSSCLHCSDSNILYFGCHLYLFIGLIHVYFLLFWRMLDWHNFFGKYPTWMYLASLISVDNSLQTRSQPLPVVLLWLIADDYGSQPLLVFLQWMKADNYDSQLSIAGGKWSEPNPKFHIHQLWELQNIRTPRS